MKMPVKFAGFVFLFASLCAFNAQARDTTHFLPIKDAIELGKGKEASWQFADDIKLYFADQPHPSVTATLVKGIVTNKKTNAANKSDEEVCHTAMLSAMIQLQQAARERGANAVVNIESFYKKKVFRNNNQFECHAGSIMAGVTLRGDIVNLKK
jgi:uncharacterized protein YbjQ (UPF0145 family)